MSTFCEHDSSLYQDEKQPNTNMTSKIASRFDELQCSRNINIQ